jgi:hypothetical protein
VQQAASSLSISLWAIKQYCDAMNERLGEAAKLSSKYIQDVRTKMPEGVEHVIVTAYAEGALKGKRDVDSKGYKPNKDPQLPMKTGGGATQLANRVAHALAKGYYDAGNVGPTQWMPVAGKPATPPLRR